MIGKGWMVIVAIVVVMAWLIFLACILASCRPTGPVAAAPDATPVAPEPGTLPLVGLGLVVLALTKRRKKLT